MKLAETLHPPPLICELRRTPEIHTEVAKVKKRVTKEI